MIDLAVQLKQGEYDFVIENQGLKSEIGLKSAILISLLTDARAMPEDNISSSDLRGWWGDSLEPESASLGSRLWTLRGRPITAIMAKAQSFAQEALNWLLEDGVASKIEIKTYRHQTEALGFAITIYSPTRETHKYDIIWSTINGME